MRWVIDSNKDIYDLSREEIHKLSTRELCVLISRRNALRGENGRVTNAAISNLIRMDELNIRDEQGNRMLDASLEMITPEEQVKLMDETIPKLPPPEENPNGQSNGHVA